MAIYRAAAGYSAFRLSITRLDFEIQVYKMEKCIEFTIRRNAYVFVNVCRRRRRREAKFRANRSRTRCVFSANWFSWLRCSLAYAPFPRYLRKKRTLFEWNSIRSIDSCMRACEACFHTCPLHNKVVSKAIRKRDDWMEGKVSRFYFEASRINVEHPIKERNEMTRPLNSSLLG